MTELKMKVDSAEEATIIIGIHQELKRAEKIHDWKGNDLFKQVCILTEEAGEVAKAAIDFDSGKHDIYGLKEELTQTAAMCIRILKNLDSTINEQK